jgi:hypothetical protein
MTPSLSCHFAICYVLPKVGSKHVDDQEKVGFRACTEESAAGRKQTIRDKVSLFRSIPPCERSLKHGIIVGIPHF